MTELPTADRPEPQRTTVAVIGAGISGLIAARELHRRGIDVLVLESADRVGGRTLTETSSLGSRLDLGGQWIGYGHHRFEALADELGATRFQMHTPKNPAIVDDGRALVTTAPSMIVAQAALVAIELLSRVPAPQRWNCTSVQTWLRRIPSDRARRLITALVEVISCTGTADLSVQGFLWLLRHQGGLSVMMKSQGGAQHALVRDGAGTLAERLAAELGDRVRTGRRVTGIRQTGDAVMVDTATGSVHASKAVVTVPPPMTRDISFDPPLPAQRIALQHNTYMGSVYKAIAVYDQPFWRIRADAEAILLDHPVCAVFDTSPPDGPGHLCLLVTGPEVHALDGLDAQQRRSMLLGRLAERLGPDVQRPASWHEKSWHHDEFVGGGYVALPVRGTREGFYPVASTPVGNIHWAGSETAHEHAGYIEGAIASGERAAQEIGPALEK